MAELTSTELRAYLQSRRKRANRDVIPEFDDFLEDVESVFRLRVAAETNYKGNRHLAYNARGELPITWMKVDEILNPKEDLPEESLISDVARKCVNEAESLLRDMRKVLTREREKVPLGNVQQMDAQCLRWLIRQPGRDHIEKAGPQQRIQAIVRKESYNTLENRVLKDFMQRVQYLADLYLRRNHRFNQERAVRDVVRLKRISIAFLQLPVMESVADLQGLPMPNYVLRQDRRYSKIWKQYCRVIRWADVSLRLWERRAEVRGTLDRLRGAIPDNVHPHAKFESFVWVNEIDGRKEILDRPFYDNQIGEKEIPAPNVKVRTGTVVVDLVGARQERNILVYGRHSNAKPYLQNFSKPNMEDLKRGRYYLLQQILDAQDTEKLCDYFEQLKAHVGGEKWIVLVPDDWDALWQEKVIRSIPLLRSTVFLLWRSIAVVLGVSKHNQERMNHASSVVVHDYQYGHNYLRSQLDLDWNDERTRKIPRRCAFRSAPGNYTRKFKAQPSVLPETQRLYGRAYHSDPVSDDYFLRPADKRTIPILSGMFFGQTRRLDNNESTSDFVVDNEGWLAHEGALYFAELQEHGETAYYDELEALSIVGQNVDRESVVDYALVVPDKKWPGGKIKEASVADAVYLNPATHEIEFYLCLGEITDSTALKVLKIETNEAYNERKMLVLNSRMVPGQGLAVVTVNGLTKPIVLDYVNNMRDSKMTIARLQNQMERSFPPEAPSVIADDGMWQNVRARVFQYVDGGNTSGRTPRSVLDRDFATAFGSARNVYTETTLPPGASRLLLLKRKNVLGNDEWSRFPYEREGSDIFEEFFKRLARDYHNNPFDNDVIRVIAWTYQYDNVEFKKIKQIVLKRLQAAIRNQMEHGYQIKTQEYTLLANLCNTKMEWNICLDCVVARFGMSWRDDINNFVRMLYNLLQFNPLILEAPSDEICDKLIKGLCFWYKYYLDLNAPQIKSGLLRCMLYLLRRRRFDGKRFLAEGSEMRVRVQGLLQHKLGDARLDTLRKVVLEYLNGRGTIDGLVAVAE